MRPSKIYGNQFFPDSFYCHASRDFSRACIASCRQTLMIHIHGPKPCWTVLWFGEPHQPCGRHFCAIICRNIFFYEFSFAIHTKLPHCQSPLRSVAPSRCEKGGSERAEYNDAKVLVRPGTAYGAIRGGSYIFAHSGCCAMALLGASVQECSRFALSGIGNYSLFFCLLQLFCFLYCFLPFTPKQCSNLH